MATLSTTIPLDLVNDSTELLVSGSVRVTRSTLDRLEFTLGGAEFRIDLELGSSFDLRATRYEVRLGSDFFILANINVPVDRFLDEDNPISLSELNTLLYNGADILNGSFGDDTLSGFNGDDLIRGEGGTNTLFGGNGNDILVAGPRDDGDYFGGNGNDTVRYELASQAVTIDLADSAQNARGALRDSFTSIENLLATRLDDEVFGTAARNRLEGDDGNDLLDGRDGIDVLLGGEGDDTLIGGAEGDRVNGGAGDDTASYAGSLARNQVDLDGLRAFLGDAEGDTLISIENLQGGERVDILFGDEAGNLIDGGAGNDRVTGRAGDDTLMGQAGIDKLYGNAGQDIMTGGAGNDRFIYFRLTDSKAGAESRDIITDFNTNGDRIEISRLDADATRGGNQRFEFIRFDQFSGTAGELRFGREGTNTVIQADTDGDAQADFEIEITGFVGLQAEDFLL